MLINRFIRVAGMAGVVVAVSCVTGFGQIIYGQSPSGDAGFVYSHWSIGDTIKVNQMMLPISGFIPLQDNLELRFSATNASNKLEGGGEDYKLSGMSDLRLQINQSLADDRFLLSLGLNLPTGKKKLNFNEEWVVLKVLSLDYLDFPVRHLGEGFGFNIMAGGAEMLGSMRVGGALMYQYNGTYEPYETGDEYNPGNQFSVISGVDQTGDGYMLTANAVYSVYTTDKLEDRKIFCQSPTFSLLLGGNFDNKTYQIGADAGLLLRGRNARYDSTEAKIEQLKAYGNEFLIAGRFSWVPDKNWRMTPSAELRVIGENEYNLEGANIFGLGGEIVRNIGEGVDIGVAFKYFTGSVDGGDIDLSGYQLSASLMAAFK
jgi:hypothetical protein